MEWRTLDAFCLFVGYGRSGHSVLASLLDAHPHAAIAHELHAVKRYFEGVPRQALFDAIWERSQHDAREGRRAPRADGGTYEHRFDGQVKTSAEALRVIGDKKGAGTAWQFARRGVDKLDDFRRYLAVPLKCLHVVRNPFDIVAAGLARRGASRFPAVLPIVAEMRRRSSGQDWLDVYHEDLVARPSEELRRILSFLGLAEPDGYAERCAGYLYREPHRRRFEVTWPAELREEVTRLIQRHDFLRRYSWES